MPFTSIFSFCPKANHWSFGKRILRIGGTEKLCFFESAILDFIFSKIRFFFASLPWKSVKVSGVVRMGLNFDDYSGFQKISGVPILLQHSVGHLNSLHRKGAKTQYDISWFYQKYCFSKHQNKAALKTWMALKSKVVILAPLSLIDRTGLYNLTAH